MTVTTLAPRSEVPQVLIVEDEYFLADDLARASIRQGLGVVGPVATREEALALLASGTAIDAAILDVNLFGADTYEIAATLARQGTPFVFATGYDPVRADFMSVMHWPKPFEADLVVQSVRAMIRR